MAWHACTWTAPQKYPDRYNFLERALRKGILPGAATPLLVRTFQQMLKGKTVPSGLVLHMNAWNYSYFKLTF